MFPRLAAAAFLLATTASASSASADEIQRLRSASAADYQRFCQSADRQENAYCAGLLFAQTGSKGVCIPAGLDGKAILAKALPAVASLHLSQADTQASIALQAMKTSFPCG
jgi:hypothetical protein